MEKSQNETNEYKIRYGHGIAAGIVAIVSGLIVQLLRYLLPTTFPFEYFLISYLIIAVLISASLFLSKRNLIFGLVFMGLSFVMSIVNDLLFLVLNFWKLGFYPLVLINLLLISNFLLIGISIGNLAKIWKFERST